MLVSPATFHLYVPLYGRTESSRRSQHVVKAPSAGHVHGLAVTAGQQVRDSSVLFSIKVSNFFKTNIFNEPTNLNEDRLTISPDIARRNSVQSRRNNSK